MRIVHRFSFCFAIKLNNNNNRQDSETNSCRVCSEANYYGTTACGSTSNNEKTAELLSSNIVEEKQALSKLYLACGGELIYFS